MSRKNKAKKENSKSAAASSQKKEEKETMSRGKQIDRPSILDSFESISKSDKNHFVKLAEKMGISEEELLSLTINALVKGKIKFETKKIYVLA